MSLPFAVVWLGRAQSSVKPQSPGTCTQRYKDSVAYTYRASLPMANIQYLCCSPIKSDPTYTTYSPPRPDPFRRNRFSLRLCTTYRIGHIRILSSRISPRTTFLGPPRSLKAVLNVKATLQERERRRRLETARCLSILPPSAFLFNPGGQNDDRGKVVCPCPLKRILLQHPIHQHRHHTPHTRTARVSVVNTRTWARISPSSRKRRLPTLRGARTVSDGCVASRWHHMLALLHLTY
jgi:hypothetical protein